MHGLFSSLCVHMLAHVHGCVGQCVFLCVRVRTYMRAFFFSISVKNVPAFS
jgi:hypothetical protein